LASLLCYLAFKGHRKNEEEDGYKDDKQDYDDEEAPEAFLGHGKTLLSLFGSPFLDLAYAGLSPGVTWEAAF